MKLYQQKLFIVSLLLLLAACSSGGGGGGSTSTDTSTSGATSSDPNMGTLATTVSEYHLPAAIDADVLPGVKTEEWASVYRPQNLGSSPLPLIVFLHGNHSTCGSSGTPITQDGCQYTFTGTCPAGDTVIPNHRGYDYLANRLASFGYLVVSINANLGITCGNPVTGDNGLVLARGRLILRHLQLLSDWNANGGTPSSIGTELKGKIDFSNVGLFGHSRGGEGVRAAFTLYQNDTKASTPWKQQILSPVVFKGIFEVGPTDGQSAMSLNAVGTAWNVLLPMCDGDVVQLQGMKPYDRMLKISDNFPLPKSQYAVWGANHDFYNTEWQNSDSAGCVGMNPLWNKGDSASVSQQNTAVGSVIPFFRAYVGLNSNTALAQGLDPAYPLSSTVSELTNVDRTFTVSTDLQMENFTGSATTGSRGGLFDNPNVNVSMVSVPEHDTALTAAQLSWTNGNANTYFQDNWQATVGSLLTLNNQTVNSFDFRVSRANDPTLNASISTDFEVQLVFSGGVLGTPVLASNYVSLVGPIGSSGSILNNTTTADLHSTLSTVRIPLSVLASQGVNNAVGVRFTFNGTSSGNIYISDINFSATSTSPGASYIQTRLPASGAASQSLLNAKPVTVNRLASVARSSVPNGYTEIQVQSDTPFAVRNALPVLHLNGTEVAAGGFSPSGDLHTMIFQVKTSDIDALANSVALDVGYKEDPNGEVRSVGVVPKTMLQNR